MRTILQVFILFLTLNNCSVNKNNHSTPINNGYLIGEWIHSHEEDKDDIKVFRLSTYNFPPSRGREKINLTANGILVYTPISPNDVPNPYNGTWSKNRSELILQYNNRKKAYTIIESTKSILKVK